MTESSGVEILAFDKQSNLEFLTKVDGFRGATAALKSTICQMMQKQLWPADTKIFSEGDEPEALYLIESDEVAVLKNDVEIATLKEMSIFGEMGILDSKPRGACVKTKGQALSLIHISEPTRPY